MDEVVTASSNAALMRRIVQLENERDELRRDVEALCMQQSGESSRAGDYMLRLQDRRLAGFEKESEMYKNQVTAYKRDIENLQEELSELYRIKGQISELYKNEAEKNKNLEHELKFFQEKMAFSMGERDKLHLEIERMQNHERELDEDHRLSRRRQKELTRENEEKSVKLEEMEESLEALKSELQVYHQVINKFWRLRDLTQDVEEPVALEQARILAADAEGSWTFGEFAEQQKQLQLKVDSLQSTNASLEEELASVKADGHQLRDAKEKADASVVDLEMRLVKFGVYLGSAIQELYLCHRRLKNDASVMIKTERSFLEATLSSFQEIAEKVKAADTSSTTGSRITSDSCDTATSSEVQEKETTGKVVSQQAFLQALEDKVSALMLLSQEEERHHLECKTSGALEYQLEQINEKLSQVTIEKVEALMQVAKLKYDCDQLKDRERELLKRLEKPSSSSTGGRLLPASWAATTVPEETEQERLQQPPPPTTTTTTTTTSYLKSWLRGSGE